MKMAAFVEANAAKREVVELLDRRRRKRTLVDGFGFDEAKLSDQLAGQFVKRPAHPLKVFGQMPHGDGRASPKQSAASNVYAAGGS